MFRVNLLELRRYILSDRWRTDRAFLYWLILVSTCRVLGILLHPPLLVLSIEVMLHPLLPRIIRTILLSIYVFAMEVKAIRLFPAAVGNCLPSLAIQFRPSAFRDFESSTSTLRSMSVGRWTHRSHQATKFIPFRCYESNFRLFTKLLYRESLFISTDIFNSCASLFIIFSYQYAKQ